MAQRSKNSWVRGGFPRRQDFSRAREVEAILICVPTPLDQHREPDLSYVLDTGRFIAPHLQRGTLVVLESTTYPGTTEGDLREVLKAGSGLRRELISIWRFLQSGKTPGTPGAKSGWFRNLSAAYTPACLDKAVGLYRHGDQNGGAGFLLSRGGSDKAAREHFPQR